MKIRHLILAMSCIVYGGCSVQNNEDLTSMFLGNAQRTGQDSDSNLSESPQLNWKYNCGGAIVSSPVISGDLLLFGNEENLFIALDKNTGKEEWKYETGGKNNSSPAVDTERVYFYSSDANFYALNINDGSLSWKFKTKSEKRFGAFNLWGNTPLDIFKEDPWDCFLSSPALDDGILYFGSGDSTIYALNAETGDEVWSYKTGNVVHSSPAVYGGKIICGSFDGFLYALDKRNGSMIWKLDTGQDKERNVSVGIQGSPIVFDGMVYVGTRSGLLLAVDVETGNIKWKYSHPQRSWISGSPAVSNGIVSFGTSDGFSFTGLNAQTGEVVFDSSVGAWVFSSPAVTGDKAYFGSHNGIFYSVDLNTGDLNPIFSTDGFRNNPGIYINEGNADRAMFGKPDDENNTYRFLLKAIRMRLESGAILSSTLIEKNVIYFGSMDGNLYSLK